MALYNPPANELPPMVDDQEPLLLRKIAKLLANAYGASGSGGGGAGAQTATLASSAATSNGTIAAGARAVSISLSSDFSGTVNGVARAAGSLVLIEAPPGTVLPEIPYTRAAGTLTIDVLS